MSTTPEVVEGFTPFPPDSPYLKKRIEVPRDPPVTHYDHQKRINTPEMTYAEAMDALAAGTLPRSVLTEKGHVVPS